MAVSLHPDMAIIQEAQKGAYGGTTLARQRADWSAYTASLAEPPPSGMAVRDTTIPISGHAVPVQMVSYCRE